MVHLNAEILKFFLRFSCLFMVLFVLFVIFFIKWGVLLNNTNKE